jgi:tetrahydromethanopterin S-methyltransferase subunit C
VIVASINLLSVVPANVYGYAATAGLALTAGTAANSTAMNLTNPVLLVIVSTIIGAIFGMLSGKLAGMLGK